MYLQTRYVCGFAFLTIVNGILPGKFPAMTTKARKPAPSYFAYEYHPHTMNGHVPRAFNYSVNENCPSLNPMEAKMPRKKKSGKAVGRRGTLALTPIQTLFAGQLARHYDATGPLPDRLLILIRRLDEGDTGRAYEN